MGGVLSSVFGGGGEEAVAANESEQSRVMKFSSSARWQLHFNEIKESSKLVRIDQIRFVRCEIELTDIGF